MSNNDVKNNDAGNRGMIEVKGKKALKTSHSDSVSCSCSVHCCSGC
jgi:hypothetical protein